MSEPRRGEGIVERVIEFSIRNRFLVLSAWLLVAVWGVHSVLHTPVDAIPDLSENQVIVFTDWMGRSPHEIEDQVTYPLSVNLQGLAGVKAVRSSSEFNFSMIDIIFEDDVDFYFARERVLERLTLASTFLPQGVVPYLAPDATALGQVFWYTLEGKDQEPGRLRAVQDWFVRYQLNSVPGVAQCASVGGYPIEYQVDVDPVKLRSYGVTLGDVFSAVSRSNSAVGGRVVHKGNAEYLIRGVGWIRSTRDIESTVVRAEPGRGTAITVSNVATVSLGPQFRRSVLEKNGDEVTGGVVLMRQGENPLEVTRRIKQKIQQLQPGLPEGVRIVPFYDRTRLIEGAIETLTRVLEHEMLIASIAILLVLGHLRSAFVICVTLPMSVLISFILMRRFGIASNIMSLAGIAISIGILVDQAIVMVENATHHLTERFAGGKIVGDTRELVLPACKTVGRPIFFSVLIILLSFIPVFALSGQEGKIFHPLAFTKTFAMVGVALLSITLVPALIPSFIRGRLKREEESWLVRTLIEIYKPVLSWAVNYPKTTIWFFVVLLALGWHLWGKIGSEYMPPLDEGSILDMPVTVPRASVAETADDLKARNAITRRFPEVEMVVGKGGRAETPTDPSPLDMVETVIDLRPIELWPKRALRYEDARDEVGRALAALVEKGLVRAGSEEQGKALADVATMNALSRFDGAMRELVKTRHEELEVGLGRELVREVVDELLGRFRAAGRLLREPDERALVLDLAPGFAGRFAPGPAQEDVTKLVQEAASRLDSLGVVHLDRDLLALRPGAVREAYLRVAELLGRERPTLFTELHGFAHERLRAHWSEALRAIDDEVFDEGTGAFDWYALEELAREANARGSWADAPVPADGLAEGSPLLSTLQAIRAALDGPFASRVFFWKKTKNDLVKEMDSVLQVPGWGNIWTQPIINRIDMLATGVRTMIGVKVFGTDQDDIQRVSEDVARVLRDVPGAVDVFPDQVAGKGYIEITVDRRRAGRYGVNVGDVQDVIEVALGGKAITQTVEGRERFPVRVRYARDGREDEEKIANLLVSAANAPGERPLQVPLSMVADIRVVEGPSMIKSENGLLRSYVQLNVRDRDLVGFVEEAQRTVDQKVKLPRGVFLEWSGQFEHEVRAWRTLLLVFPAVIALIFLILYFTYNDLMDAILMVMAVPEALAGGVFLLWLTGTSYSVAVGVGFIACFGMATETGIIMLVYLREAIERKGGLEKIASLEELKQTIIEGAVHRLRPKLLTEGVAIISLAPMLWASGAGHEVLAAMAAPVLGGLLVSDEVVDIFIPVRFYWVRRARWLELHGRSES